MQTGFGKCKYFNFKQNIIWIRWDGFINEGRIASDNGFEPTKNKTNKLLAPGRSGYHCKNALVNIAFLIVIVGFSYDNTIGCHGPTLW